jgi:membrane-bound metal-dependent hydrolase YbcI (DUF457 family)
MAAAVPGELHATLAERGPDADAAAVCAFFAEREQADLRSLRALAPDLDEHESLGGRANPISELPIFGGHRTRTHTLLAVVLVTAATLACEHFVLATAVLVGFMACMGGAVVSRDLRQAGAFLSVPFGALAGYLSYHFVHAGWWLTAAVALPYLSHLMADSLTKGGVPWLMPLTKHDFTLGLMKTGHFLEQAVFTPLFMVAAAAASWVAFRPTVQVLVHQAQTTAAHIH